MIVDQSPANDFDRLPPHSLDAEMCVLASMMLEGECIPAVRVILPRKEDFYSADHQVIFEVVCHLYDEHHPIDAVLAREELVRRDLLKDVGGTEYLSRILNAVPSAAHAIYYAGIVREKATLRRGIELGNELTRKCYAPAHDDVAVELLMAAAAKASTIAAGGAVEEVWRIDAVAREVLERHQTGEVLRLGTGIASLDSLIGGLRKGGKTIVGAKPGMGKSAMLKQLGRNFAHAGTPFGLITVEEGRHKVAENVLAGESGVPNNRIAFGTAGEEEWAAIEHAVQSIDGLPFYVVDSARELRRIAAMAHLLHHRFGCQVIAVDHLHIIDAGENARGSGETREREISRISADLKWVWKDLNVCGLEAAQLNRKSGRERPTLDSLRDSGSLEQDGDTILLLHREDYYRKVEGKGQPLDGVLEVIVAKNKDGATGIRPLHFDEARQIIRDHDDPPFSPPDASENLPEIE